MLETIFEWCTNACANLLDGLVNGFLSMLEFDMAIIVNEFPVLVTAYDIFQAVAIGLVIAISAISLMKFFTGQTAEARETPVSILFRALAAAALVYMGGYLVQWVVDIAKLPYDAMLNLDATEGWSEDANLNVQEVSIGLIGILGAFGTNGVVFSAAAVSLLALIMVVLIAFNVIRLIVEVCQRFLMVAVLTYSAPLVFATAASKDTSHILQKWISMFLGQCLLMTLSVWTLKAIISGFAYNAAAETNYLFKFLMTLAMCKIAQRLDTYIQQLGINAATTGGNLLGEALGAMAMLGGGRGFTRQKGSTAGVLGGAMKGLWGQGILGAIPRAVDAGKKAYGEGGSVKDAASAFGKAYTKNADPASWFGSSKTAQNRRQNSTEKAQAQQKAAAERAQAYPDMNTGTVVGGNGFVDLDNMAKDQGLHIVTPMEAPDFDRNLGDVDGEVDSPFGEGEDATAPASAGSFVTADDESVVASFINSNYTGSGVADADALQEVLQNTLNNASPAVGEAALMNPNNDLLPGQNTGKGVYANDAVGSVAMERFVGNAVKDRSSPFMGVTAYTDPDRLDDYGNYHPGGRHVHGNYQDGMGNWKNVEAVDETAYQGMISDHQKQFTPYTGPSGAQYYMKKSSGYVSPEEALKKAGVSTQQPTTTSSVAVPGTDRINPTPTGPTQPTNNVIPFPGSNGQRTDHLPAPNQDDPTSVSGSNSVIGATGSDAGRHEIGAGVDTHVGQETKIAADQMEPGMNPEIIPAQPGEIPQPGNITQDELLDDIAQTSRVESGVDVADEQLHSNSIPADNNGAYIGAVQTPARETDATDFSQGTATTMDGEQVAFDKELSHAGLELKQVSDGDAGAGSYISGEKDAVAEHLAANYSNAEEGGAAYQDIMANTAQASPAAAEAALMNRNHNLTPGEQGADGTFRNDAVGSAMMESGFAQATVDETGTQTRQGGFTNVKAQTAPDRIDEKTGEVIAGGRFVTGNFSDTDGNSKKLTVTDKAGYDSMSEAQQRNYSAFTGASGEQYYKKISVAQPVHGKVTGAADTQGAYRTGAGQTSTTQTAENLKTAPAAEKTTPNPSQSTYGNKGEVPVSAGMDGQRVNDPKNIASDSPNMPPASTNNAESVNNAPAEVSRIGATPVDQTDTLQAETPKEIGVPSHEQGGHEDAAKAKVPEASQAVHIGAGYNAAPGDETNGQGPAFGERKGTEYSGTPGGESFESDPTIEKKTDAGYSATSGDEPIEQGPVIGEKNAAGYSNTADAKTTSQGPVIEPKNEEPFVSQAPNKETLPVAETSLPMESKGAELKAQQPETHQPEIQQEVQQPTIPGDANIQKEGTVSNSLGESLNEPGSRHEVGAVTTEQPTETAGTGSAESREETREVDRENAHEPARKIGAGASLGTSGGELGGDTQSDNAFSGGGNHENGSSKRDERPSEDRHAGGEGGQGEASGNRPNRYADTDNSTGYGHPERKYPERETPYSEKKATNTSPSDPTHKPLENSQSAVTQTVQTPAPVAPTQVQKPQQQQTVVEQKAAPASGRAAVVQQAAKDSAVVAQARAESPEEQPVRVQERRDTKAREQTIVSEERSTTMGAKHAANTGDHHRKNEGSKLSGQGAGKNPAHKEKPTGHHEIDLALGDDHGLSAGGSSNKRNKPFGGGAFGRKNRKN